MKRKESSWAAWLIHRCALLTESSEKAVGVQAADEAFSEEAATEGGAGAQGGEEEDDDDLDIQLDGPDTAQEQAGSEVCLHLA